MAEIVDLTKQRNINNSKNHVITNQVKINSDYQAEMLYKGFIFDMEISILLFSNYTNFAGCLNGIANYPENPPNEFYELLILDEVDNGYKFLIFLCVDYENNENLLAAIIEIVHNVNNFVPFGIEYTYKDLALEISKLYTALLNTIKQSH